MSGLNSSDRENMLSNIEKMSTEELEAILRQDSQSADNKESDLDLVIHIMEVIAAREAGSHKYTDVDVAWNAFRNKYLSHSEQSDSNTDLSSETKSQLKNIEQNNSIKSHKSHKKMLGHIAASIAACIMIVVLGSTTVANALGYDLWGAIAQWTQDTFGFAVENSVSPANDYPDSMQRSLRKTLSEYGINQKLAPTWYPDGYACDNVEVSEAPTRTTYTAIFKKDEQSIIVSIRELSTLSPRTHEKDDDTVVTYLANGIEHYIMSNINQSKIVWKNENFEASISGDFSPEEAKKIIDSIYERQ